MNDLNSVIVEGKVTTVAENINLIKCSIDFTINNNKTSDGKSVTTEIFARVEGEFATNCKSKLEVGKSVRLVGKIANEGGRMFILCEYIDFKK